MCLTSKNRIFQSVLRHNDSKVSISLMSEARQARANFSIFCSQNLHVQMFKISRCNLIFLLLFIFVSVVFLLKTDLDGSQKRSYVVTGNTPNKPAGKKLRDGSRDETKSPARRSLGFQHLSPTQRVFIHYSLTYLLYMNEWIAFEPVVIFLCLF